MFAICARIALDSMSSILLDDGLMIESTLNITHSATEPRGNGCHSTKVVSIAAIARLGAETPSEILVIASNSPHSDSSFGSGDAVFSIILADSSFEGRIAKVAFLVSFRFSSVSLGLPSLLLERLIPINGGVLEMTETELIGARFGSPLDEIVETNTNGLGEIMAESHWVLS